MKVKELKGLIREVVKKTLLEASYDQYGEGFYSMESAGGSSVEDKMEQAVDIAVDAAETLSRMDRYDHMEVDLATDKAVSKIVRLFLDPNGDFSDENADPNEMAQDMHDMLSMRVDRSEENLAVFDHADKLILKALNKLRMMEESVLAEALYEKHVGFKNLVTKLQGQGKSAESAKKIAYSIGKKKYGKEKMAQAAASGKQLSDKEALDEITQSLMGVSVGATEEDLARKIAHYMANKSDEPHYKEQPSSKRGTPEKKKGQ